MKILILAKGYPPTIGGVENYSYYISEGLSNNHDVEVLTFQDIVKSDYGFNENANVTRLNHSKKEWRNGWLMFKSVQKKLSEFSPDAIIATTWKVALPISIFKHTYNIPIVVVAHGAEITRHRKKLVLQNFMKYVLKRADLIITVSEFTNEIVKKYVSIANNKIVTVHNGINMDSIKPIKKDIARHKLGIKIAQPLILTVSRLDGRKGHSKILNLLPKLKKIYPDLKYLIVGDGPHRMTLEELSSSLGLKKSDVEFFGYVPAEDLSLYYSAADIFIMLNEMVTEEDFEGFGFVFAEAGAYGIPVIGGNNGGPKEVIEHNKTGFLVDPDSEEEIIKAIVTLLNDKEKAFHIGESARKKVNDEFTLETMVSNFEKLIKRL